ncbi:uncharacterized protein HGUI_01841 [Hanseniaspora guilliermondii]|uniref:Uncharacterized protein n=1 Tax=Hanseniaspora guilliermondii TaxID=56406 RepID=A0A1L0CMK4_9ASCO|nr:uncharacterized protein HGUI_01841 [Hanseniaspora guilliermondii]
MTRPFCNTCKSKNKLVCEGYDVKLRWSDPIEFDIYGDVSANPKNSKILDSDNKDPQYQRRKIKFLHYKKEYMYYEDMDEELSLLNKALTHYRDKLSGGNTWMIEKFGVFEGIKFEKILKKKELKKMKSKKAAVKNKRITAAKKRIIKKSHKKKALPVKTLYSTKSQDQDFFANMLQSINDISKRNDFTSPIPGIIEHHDIANNNFNMHNSRHEIGLMYNDIPERYDRKQHDFQDKTEVSLNAYFEEIFKNNNTSNNYNSELNPVFLNKNDDYSSGINDSASIDIHKFLINDNDGKRHNRYDEGTMESTIQCDHVLLNNDIKELERKKADLLQDISELLQLKANIAKDIFE